MSIPENAAGAVVRRRNAGRAALEWAFAHPVLPGVAFLVLCGWKFTFGLRHVLDLDPDHEATYLDYLLTARTDHVPSEYSPLYVGLYAVEHWLFQDPIRLFYANVILLTLALPISFYVYLSVRRVPVELALPCALYLMIARANLPTLPKMMHFCLIVALLSAAILVRLGDRPARWGFLVAACAALSLIRPELLYALIVVGGWSVWLVVARRERSGELVAWLGVGAAVAAGLYWAFGVPLFGERSMLAFAWHFGANYMTWHGREIDVAFGGDFWSVYRAVFGGAESIPAALIANPGAFLHHVLTNLVHAPSVIAGRFLSHYNLLLPPQRIAMAIEGALLGVVLLGLAVVWATRNGWRERGFGRGGPPLRGGFVPTLRRIGGAYPDVVFLTVLALPYPLMILVLYPRQHYALMAGTIALAIALVLSSGGTRTRLPRSAVLFLPLLLAMVPTLWSEGADLDRPYDKSEAAVTPRPALAEARFLRSLNLRGPVAVLEATDPGISPYVGPNFHSLPHVIGEHTLGFGELLGNRELAIVLEDDRLRAVGRARAAPEWAAFKAEPQRFGFEARPVPGADAIVYLRRGLAD